MKVCMLVRNNCVYDNRVLKEAEVLAKDGYDINIVAIKDEQTPEYEEKNGVKFHRVPKTSVLIGKSRGNYLKKVEKSIAYFTDKKNSLKTNFTNNLDKIVDQINQKKTLLRESYLDKTQKRKNSHNNALTAVFRKPILYLSKIKYKLQVKIISFIPRMFIKAYRVLYKLKNKSNTLIYKLQRKYYKFIYEKRNKIIIKSKPIYGIVDFHKNSIDTLVRINADVYHSHDLNTLFTGYKVKKLTGAKLVYDSHELEIDRNLINATKFEKLVWRVLEKYLIRKCDEVITVSDGISEFLSNYYNIKKPTVLLNAPKYYEPVKSKELQKKFENKKVILYVGAITANRGLEQTVEAMKYVNKDAVFVVIGPRNEGIYNNLKEIIENQNLKDRVYLLDPVPVDQIKFYTSNADIGVVPGLNVCLSYDLSLPSKFFEYAFAELPMGVGNLSELSRLVSQNNIGLSFDQTNPEDIAKKLNLILKDLSKFKSVVNFNRIRNEMCWEQEQKKLIFLYENLRNSS